MYAVRLYENGACFGLADGCGWGPRSCKAAADAIAGFSEYVDRKLSSVTDVGAAARFLLRAVCSANDRIWTMNQQTWEVGTTTMLAALLVKVDEKRSAPENSPFKGAPYVLVCANIGDCKAFVVCGGKRTDVIDITVESKRTSKDKCDPGGRIGPYIQGNPDTRNLLLSTVPVYPGDTICIVSDGVHDNLDPETLGLPLQHSMDRNPAIAKQMLDQHASGGENLGKLSEDFNTNKAWDVLSAEWSELLKAEYREFIISQLIEKGADTPSKLLESLFDHCMRTTKASREFMEKNPANVHPPDYVTFPGKMDHTTGIIYVVPGSPPDNRPFQQPHSFNSNEVTQADTESEDKKSKKSRRRVKDNSAIASSSGIVEMAPRKAKPSSKKANQEAIHASGSAKEEEEDEDDEVEDATTNTKKHPKKRSDSPKNEYKEMESAEAQRRDASTDDSGPERRQKKRTKKVMAEQHSASSEQ